MLVHLGVTVMSPRTRTVPMKIKNVVGGHVPIFSAQNSHLVEFRLSFRYISHHSPLACTLLPLDHVNCSNSFLYHILPVLYTVGQRYQRTI